MITDNQSLPISKPNNCWETAKIYWQTNLSADLFQLIEQISAISPFVKKVFSRYPVICAEYLVWQNQTENHVFASELSEHYQNFSQDNSVLTEALAMKKLRVFRYCQSAVIALKELAGQYKVECSAYRISVLADLMIKTSSHYAAELLKPRFGSAVNAKGEQQNLLVLGMGKLGGLELNFSSDIDLIFFYQSGGQSIGAGRSIDNSRYFQKLAVLMIKLLDEVSEDGFVYRVDMRLRPYGDSGALVMTLSQAEDYYQEQGREWERFAMVRARVITGAPAEQTALVKILQPFCFRKYIDYGVIDSIRSMKSMIVREVNRKGLTNNIKLGAGGIREIEFIVQALQLIQGGRDKQLTEKNILTVLPSIVAAKLLPQSTSEILANAYRFLRRIEHCIQELDEKQTHQLPSSQAEQNIIAEVMGFADWHTFTQCLQQHQSAVNYHFSELLGEERNRAVTQDDFYQSLFEGHINAKQLSEKVTAECNKSYSAEEATQFLERLNAFVTSSQVISLSARGAERVKTFFPVLLSACLKMPEPQVALNRTLIIIQAILKRTAYLDLLSENQPILFHLVELASKSEWIVKRLSEHPILFDELLYPNSLYAPLQSADLESELRQSLLRVSNNDEEDLLDSLRAFKQINELRVAAALLAERLSISQVSRYLSELAQVILNIAIELAWKMITPKHGKPQSLADGDGNSLSDSDFGFAVIGYGKLGGMELGFGSDLDLVFLFNQPVDESTNGKRSLNNSRFYTRLAQKLIHILSTRTNLGLLYEVDMRLRPSGASGLLVSHIEAYQEYQMESAWTWEHQALIRARFVAGDYKLLPEFEAARNAALKKSRDLSQLKQDVIDMRAKMRQQLEVKAAGKIDLKQGQGGLVDIEFLAQYLCLSYQGDKTIPYATTDCLKFCIDENLIKQSDANSLIKNYRIFRNRLNENALLAEGELVEDKLAASESLINNMQAVFTIWETLLLNIRKQ